MQCKQSNEVCGLHGLYRIFIPGRSSQFYKWLCLWIWHLPQIASGFVRFWQAARAAQLELQVTLLDSVL